jgi:5-formyltetrahydrofolate cyclo-ligase
MTRKEEKIRLRAVMRAEEKKLGAKYKAESSAAICRHVLAMPEYRDAETVFCFVGRQHEIDTTPLLRQILADGKRLCVPLCVEKGIMELRQISAIEDLIPGSYGIQEPPADAPTVSVDDVDLSIIPCLTCDHGGRRLGFGGGYYDRFLGAYRSAAVLVCRERLIREELPVEPHDMPVPWVITERGLYEDGIPAPLS